MHKYDICDRFAISRAFLRAHNAPDGSPQNFHKFIKIFPKVYKDISATIDKDISTTIEKGIFRTKGFTKEKNNELLINKYKPINKNIFLRLDKPACLSLSRSLDLLLFKMYLYSYF